MSRRAMMTLKTTYRQRQLVCRNKIRHTARQSTRIYKLSLSTAVLVFFPVSSIATQLRHRHNHACLHLHSSFAPLLEWRFTIHILNSSFNFRWWSSIYSFFSYSFSLSHLHFYFRHDGCSQKNCLCIPTISCLCNDIMSAHAMQA